MRSAVSVVDGSYPLCSPVRIVLVFPGPGFSSQLQNTKTQITTKKGIVKFVGGVKGSFAALRRDCTCFHRFKDINYPIAVLLAS